MWGSVVLVSGPVWLGVFHSFIYSHSTDHTDVEFVINTSINKQLYTNTSTISDREIHVSMEHRFKHFPYISNTYKGRVLGSTHFNTNIIL